MGSNGDGRCNTLVDALTHGGRIYPVLSGDSDLQHVHGVGIGAIGPDNGDGILAHLALAGHEGVDHGQVHELAPDLHHRVASTVMGNHPFAASPAGGTPSSFDGCLITQCIPDEHRSGSIEVGNDHTSPRPRFEGSSVSIDGLQEEELGCRIVEAASILARHE